MQLSQLRENFTHFVSVLTLSAPKTIFLVQNQYSQPPHPSPPVVSLRVNSDTSRSEPLFFSQFGVCLTK